MTGFNVNCKDCSYCCVMSSLYDTYFCIISGDYVDTDCNTDCCDYEPIRTTNDE